jgi:hypothetical protein
MKVCFTCEALTAHWVLWSNAAGDAYVFCDSECMARWMERAMHEVLQGTMQSSGEETEDPYDRFFLRFD